MTDIYPALRRLAEAPEGRGVLAQIAATSGSAPRAAGARMLLGADGTFSGTVGGGGLEKHAEEECRRVLASGQPSRRTYSLGNEPGEATGAICGGSAVVDFLPLGPAEARALLEELPPPPRVLVYGAGHVGKALADALYLLGMDVTVTDQRAELLTPERFPHALRCVVPAPETAVDAGASDLVVIATHSHALDYDLALGALRSPARYVGLIGSRRKNELFRPRLIRDGIPPAALEERLHSPVGLPIGAETPEEIAVSIAAELIAELRRPQ